MKTLGTLRRPLQSPEAVGPPFLEDLPPDARRGRGTAGLREVVVPFQGASEKLFVPFTGVLEACRVSGLRFR